MDNKKYILVVDDDTAIQDFVNMALTEEGYEVVTASDGLKAIELATQARPMLILLDIRMPNMDGRTFIDTYHATSKPHAPIIVLTASRSTEETVASLDIDGFLAKPFDLNDLFAMVNKYANPK